jgi:hypothetical protein
MTAWPSSWCSQSCSPAKMLANVQQFYRGFPCHCVEPYRNRNSVEKPLPKSGVRYQEKGSSHCTSL